MNYWPCLFVDQVRPEVPKNLVSGPLDGLGSQVVVILMVNISSHGIPIHKEIINKTNTSLDGWIGWDFCSTKW